MLPLLLLLGVPVLLAATSTAGQVDAGTKLTYGIAGIKINISKGKISLAITFKLTNPTTTPLEFKSFIGTMSAEGKTVGPISDTTPATIAANADTNIVVNASFTSKIIPQLLLAALTAKTPPSANVKGTLLVGVFSLPVDMTFPLKAADSTKSSSTTSPVKNLLSQAKSLLHKS